MLKAHGLYLTAKKEKRKAPESYIRIEDQELS
jgi:hypothetical protein